MKSLQFFFIFCLSSGIYPNSWANGYITAIHKGNDPTDPNNYRGINITGAIGKVFNRVLCLRLDKFLQDHNIIHESQIGFAKKARTADHILSTYIVVQKMGDYLHAL